MTADLRRTVSYQYTHDARQDYAGFDQLTEVQRKLGDRINRQARQDGSDRRDLLAAADADPADKTAVAELWGGRGAGEEFLR